MVGAYLGVKTNRALSLVVFSCSKPLGTPMLPSCSNHEFLHRGETEAGSQHCSVMYLVNLIVTNTACQCVPRAQLMMLSYLYVIGSHQEENSKYAGEDADQTQLFYLTGRNIN